MTVHYRKDKLVDSAIFQVRAYQLLEGDFIVALRERVRFVDHDHGTVWVHTKNRVWTWPKSKIIKVIHGR